MKFFSDCHTLNEVKAEYKRLSKMYHPDVAGPDFTSVMQQINVEYPKAIYRAANGADLSAEQTDAEILNAEQYRAALNSILALHDITIELCGGWLWISGNTYKYRSTLKSNGFYFAPAKKMWYFRTTDFATFNRKKFTIEQIRTKYGSQIIEGSKTCLIN